MLLLDTSLTEYVHLKAMTGDHHTLKMILEDDASKVHATNGRMCAPPVFYACRFGHLKVVELLIRWGADIHVPVSGWTCLHEAACANHPCIVELLLCNGAYPDAVVVYSMKTPLMQAATNGSLRVCQMLLESGSDPWKLDVNGKTAYAMASNTECKEMIGRQMRRSLITSYRHGFFWGNLPDDVFAYMLSYV